MIRLLEFHRSPNCAKVRIGLRFKGLPFEVKEMAAADRTPMLEAAHWPLVPVLLDGDVAMRDSEAILHYLESNYRDAPTLTPASVEDIRAGEGLTLEAQFRIRPVLRRLYGVVLRKPEERDLSVLASLPAALTEALTPLDEALEGKAFLLGERMSLYDVLLAAALTPLRPPPDYVAQSPMWAFFAEHVAMPEQLERLPAWIDRVTSWDT